jgi:hypothetical protein
MERDSINLDAPARVKSVQRRLQTLVEIVWRRYAHTAIFRSLLKQLRGHAAA